MLKILISSTVLKCGTKHSTNLNKLNFIDLIKKVFFCCVFAGVFDDEVCACLMKIHENQETCWRWIKRGAEDGGELLRG